MVPLPVPLSESEMPHLKCATRLAGKLANDSIYDAKFYPYNASGVDPVFAVTGDRHTIVCRPLPGHDKGIDVLRWFEDDDGDLNSLAWSRDGETGDPLLCVSGSSYQIKVLNVKSGNLVKTIIGHGGPITDLATSPVSPTILASASEDHSIRLWDLSPQHDKDPCAIICSGEGHKAGVLSVAFHPTGRYLIAGDFDSRVNLWVLPDLPEASAGVDKATMLHYPHFSSIEVHSNYVDSVAFYGDLILSKSANENKILLWKISGFDSRKPVPPRSSAPTIYSQHETRSAFSDCKHGGGFQLLLTFDAPETQPYYMRFGLFHQPHRHPILVMGNRPVRDDYGSSISFWDLQLLEDGVVGGGRSDIAGGGGPGSGRGKAKARGKARRITDGGDRSSSKGSVPPGAGGEQQHPKGNKLAGPFTALLPHRRIDNPTGYGFTPRAISWSVGGEWCVVVGDLGTICLMRRWAEGGS